MRKTSLGKSLYTTYSPDYIKKELKKEFRLPFIDISESMSDFSDIKLITVTAVCYEKDLESFNSYIKRFDYSN